ncbi:hypothetical protein HQO84_25535 [Rhodococcus fascians]|nr:hypothetical protein [Rhodococcus fascians]MBY3999480.1 hypothetical protein [Rhodococcus fascians]MBY4005013.1 hypothetical protein [Rhodococcus fascians]MBY4010114.1 hypothetical protein [Rhodococcus fascians]MBY4020220.1 hypothetical protein [Rhodococcus fascians]
MRVARLRIERFRGYRHAELVVPENMVLAGESQAGRTDIVQALRQVLDARSTRSRVNPLDIFRPADGDEAALTEVEVTLLDLGDDLETLLSENLETFDAKTGEIATSSNAGDAVLGVRLCYRARYDLDTDTGEHWVDYPARSVPPAGTFKRASRIERESLPVQFVDNAPALQLRAEGVLRGLLIDADFDGLDGALTNLDSAIHTATEAFSETDVVTEVLDKVIDSGPQLLFNIDDSASIRFLTDDGSMAALLRALQPAISMGAAGHLPVHSQGSTVESVMSAAEAVAAARDAQSGVVIIGDDFGDRLDASSSEHMARLIHVAAGQAILTTRRPEVVRAFDPGELVRLTISHGERQQHRLPTITDKTDRVNRRLVLEQLLSALSARTVVLLEGPLDVEGYGAIASRLFETTNAPRHSLPANGIRLVAPPGSDGGVTRLPAIAEIALELGFHVRAIVDNDKPGQEHPAVEALSKMVEQLVVLPTRTAVEAALIRGLSGDQLRATVDNLERFGMPLLPPHLGDDDIADHLISTKVIKKQGLGAAWAHALTHQPPIARSVIEAICGDALGRIDIPDIP